MDRSFSKHEIILSTIVTSTPSQVYVDINIAASVCRYPSLNRINFGNRMPYLNKYDLLWDDVETRWNICLEFAIHILTILTK